LSFNGTSSYVNLNNPAKLQITGSMTLSAWVYATGAPVNDGQIIAKSDNYSGWQLKTSPDTGPQTFSVAISVNSNSYTGRYSTTIRSLNTWYYVAGVYDATAQRLDIYVNGILDNGILDGTIPSLQYAPSVNVNIGRRSGGYYFKGTIDEVRIYNRALTQAEIQTDMNIPVGMSMAKAAIRPLPENYALKQNYPNPFNPATTIQYSLPMKSRVRLEIFNSLGQTVSRLIDNVEDAGYQEINWHAIGSSGIYFYRLTAVSVDDPSKRFASIKKMVLLK
jgi:hypothetical protein